ncbi:MAG: hypothetical protein ACE5Q6_01550 [Dehalococcoidia bacterium]
MILIIGHESDRSCQMTRAILQERGVEVVLINGSGLFSGEEMGFSLDRQNSDSFFTSDGRRIPYSDISTVLIRSLAQWEMAPDLSLQDRMYFVSEMWAAFNAIQRGLRCPVFNRLAPNVPYSPVVSEASARLAMECEFQIPKFLTTATMEAALDFYLRQEQQVLLDDVLGSGPFQEIIGQPGLQVLRQNISDHAISLLERPSGPMVQCLVVSDQVLAADAEGNKFELSLNSQESCRQLATSLKLPFVMILLICGDDGQDYCLNINPHPLYFQWEEQLQEKVATALADALEKSALEVIVQ